MSTKKAKRTTKTDVLKEARRLGATSEQLAAFEVNFDEHAVLEELVGSHALPDPAAATDEEFPLAAAIANTRHRIVAQHQRGLAGRQRGSDKSRAKKHLKEDNWRKGIIKLRERFRNLTAEQLRRKLLARREERQEYLGDPEAPVPSVDFIARALPE